jgi:hypothetical protein
MISFIAVLLMVTLMTDVLVIRDARIFLDAGGVPSILDDCDVFDDFSDSVAEPEPQGAETFSWSRNRNTVGFGSGSRFRSGSD